MHGEQARGHQHQVERVLRRSCPTTAISSSFEPQRSRPDALAAGGATERTSPVLCWQRSAVRAGLNKKVHCASVKLFEYAMRAPASPAVTKMIGTRRVRSAPRISSASSKLSCISGIWTSISASGNVVPRASLERFPSRSVAFRSGSSPSRRSRLRARAGSRPSRRPTRTLRVLQWFASLTLLGRLWRKRLPLSPPGRRRQCRLAPGAIAAFGASPVASRGARSLHYHGSSFARFGESRVMPNAPPWLAPVSTKAQQPTRERQPPWTRTARHDRRPRERHRLVHGHSENVRSRFDQAGDSWSGANQIVPGLTGLLVRSGSRDLRTDSVLGTARAEQARTAIGRQMHDHDIDRDARPPRNARWQDQLLERVDRACAEAPDDQCCHGSPMSELWPRRQYQWYHRSHRDEVIRNARRAAEEHQASPSSRGRWQLRAYTARRFIKPERAILQRAVEVDQHVTARHELDLCEHAVGRQAVIRENHVLAQRAIERRRAVGGSVVLGADGALGARKPMILGEGLAPARSAYIAQARPGATLRG